MEFKITTKNEIGLNCKEIDKINHIFVFAIGYEQRSVHIVQQLMEHIELGILIPVPIVFNDNDLNDDKKQIVNKLIELGHDPIYVQYNERNKVIQSFNDKLEQSKMNRIFIDYSSMPRSWYCCFPKIICNNKDIIKSAIFWYSKGKYIAEHDYYPNTCVKDDIEVFSGKATLRSDNKRMHIFGLGFDHIRTQAILSVIDTNYYGVCIAYPSDQINLLKEIKERNGEIVGSSNLTIELPIDDFCYMISKLSDVSNNYVSRGDVILVPDGPKPLIMASSMVPSVLNKYGIICLHVKRHDHIYEKIDVIATGEIYGFEMTFAES